MDWLDEPFKHSIGTGYFSDEYFRALMRNLPPEEEYEQYNDTYPNRYLWLGKGGKPADGFWKGVWDRFTREFGPKTVVQLVRDYPGYSLGPHTDKPTKLATYLFYLTDAEVDGAGTTIFVPSKAVGGTGWTHHGFDGFDAVKTAPYVPNGYFAFERSDNSYHGVFPATIVRNLLQVSVYR